MTGMLVPEPEHWTVYINGNQKEVRTVGMSMRTTISITNARTGILASSVRTIVRNYRVIIQG